jgi:hypothetical protein
MTSRCSQTQNELLLTNLLEFYKKDDNMERLMQIINGESIVSLRIIDWFVTNFAKKEFYRLFYPCQESVQHRNKRRGKHGEIQGVP